MSENDGHRDPLYLFLCHLEWHNRRNLAGYQELLAALDDNDSDIRVVAKCCCIEAHRALSQPRELSKPGEVAGRVSGIENDWQATCTSAWWVREWQL